MKMTINHPITSNLVVKKSNFICLIIPLNSEDDIILNLNNLRKEYSDARHICYAYIYETTTKYSDDKEPFGTAGIPILNNLKKANFHNVLCVVIRYFGGTLLGKSLLTRTYSKVVSETILKNKEMIYEYVKRSYYSLTFNYDLQDKVNKEIKDTIIKKEFLENIYYEAYLSQEELDKIKKLNIEIKEVNH